MPAHAREPHHPRHSLKSEAPFVSVDTTPPHLRAAEDRLREKPENPDLLPKPRKKGKKVDVQDPTETPCLVCGGELDSLHECPTCEEAVLRQEANLRIEPEGDDGGARLREQLAEEDRAGGLKDALPEQENLFTRLVELPPRPTGRRHGFKYSTSGEPAVFFLPPGLLPSDLDAVEEMFHIVMRQARRAVGAPLTQTLEPKK